jgi:xanthine/uracil/vitamin C permease (AzgA family)
MKSEMNRVNSSLGSILVILGSISTSLSLGIVATIELLLDGLCAASTLAVCCGDTNAAAVAFSFVGGGGLPAVFGDGESSFKFYTLTFSGKRRLVFNLIPRRAVQWSGSGSGCRFAFHWSWRRVIGVDRRGRDRRRFRVFIVEHG